MQVIQQVSVVIDNAPGTLARILGSLRENQISVHGFACWGESDHGIVRLVCDRPLKALDLLEEAGMIAVAAEIIELELSNQPGALFDAASALSDNGVNINYAYGSNSVDPSGRSSLYVAVTDLSAAKKLLKAF